MILGRVLFMDKVQALAISLPYIHEAFKEEATMVVVDKETETVQAYLPGKELECWLST